MKKICVLGNFSGRNAGDAAILGGLLEDVSSRYPDTLFTVPTINTGFVRRAFSRYRVKPVSLMPWNLSLKILGLPVFTSTLGAGLRERLAPAVAREKEKARRSAELLAPFLA